MLRIIIQKMFISKGKEWDFLFESRIVQIDSLNVYSFFLLLSLKPFLSIFGTKIEEHLTYVFLMIRVFKNNPRVSPTYRTFSPSNFTVQITFA